MNEAIIKLKQRIKTPKVLICAGLLGIMLIFLSTLSEKQEPQEVGNSFSAEEYRAALQQDIEKTVQSITGSDDVTCLITLESSVEYSYAETEENRTQDKSGERDKSFDSENKAGYITIKTADGGEQALLLTETMPKVRGVAIVCYLGDNEVVAEKIKSSVTAALNISSKKVYICGRNR